MAKAKGCQVQGTRFGGSVGARAAKVLAAGVISTAMAVSQFAAPAAAEGIAKNITCTFDLGTSTSYESGAFASKPAKPLTFEIADIDLEAQSARLLTGDGNGAGTLRIVRALNANHFLEVVNEGFLNLTTIYDIDPTRGTYPAVHSRHLGLLGQPVFAQYSGHCKPLP
ncbi:MAG: hypothetical protein H6876_02405 [Hyphomicrobiaceae bacterium]|nr:hypothetical protein [Hyphomicrobiaceae bacterium]MCC0006957.1 hypothetical protein [Hyphomicrobiaceae bacterium]